MINLYVLRTFVAVVDQGSVIGAARKQRYAASAVSRQMKRLQSYLGVQLFVPEGRSIRPTAAAISIADRIRPLLAEADGVERYLAAITSHSASVPNPADRGVGESAISSAYIVAS